MTSPLKQAYDVIQEATDKARHTAFEKIKPMLVEAFSKVPWLMGVKFNTDTRWNDENYYTPDLNEISFRLFFHDDDRNNNIPSYAFYEGNNWYNEGNLIDSERESFITAFAPLADDVTGDMIDLLFPEYAEWVIFSDGTIEPYDDCEPDEDDSDD
jgi:hypothetical protein